MTTPAFDPETLVTAPLWRLNLSAAQHCALEWVIDHGGYWEHIVVPVAEVAEDCGNALSTVYDALARLESLRVLLRDEAGLYRVNARVYFNQNPRVRALIAAALTDPDVTPDERAQAPRKTGNIEARRRRTVRAV